MEEKSFRDAAGRDASAWPSSAGQRGLRKFPREARLLRSSEFDAVYHGGQRRSSKQFTIFVRHTGAPITRFGFSVKKALGGAVVRNRMRRRMREALRLHRPEIAPGWDIVIHPRSSVQRAEFSALAAELVGLIRGAIASGAHSKS